MLGSKLLLAAVSLVGFAAAQEVPCWAPNGKTLADNETYVPCNKLGITQDGIFSSCCRLDGDASKRDLCTSTGLCLYKGVLTRAYCTDKTWKSNACVKVCMNDKKSGSSNGTVEITPCTDGSGKYCCGGNNLSCCGTSSAFEIDSLVDKNGKTRTGSSDNNETVSKNFKNATIGLAVALGVVVLAGAAAVFFLQHKNKTLYAQLSQTPPTAAVDAAAAEKRNPEPSPSTAKNEPVNRDDIIDAYRHGFHTGSTVASSSPGPEFQNQFKTVGGGGSSTAAPPSSPGLSEAPTHQRYSELDASSPRNEAVGSPVPGYHPGSVPENEVMQSMDSPVMGRRD